MTFGRIWSVIIILGIVIYTHATQNINISGTVKNIKGDAISGAEVSLFSDSKMCDTTNAKGAFKIINAIAIQDNKPVLITPQAISNISIQGKKLRFFIASPCHKGVFSIFSGNGKKIAGIPLDKMEPGVHTHMLPELSPGFYIMDITIPQSTITLKLLHTGNGFFISVNNPAVMGDVSYKVNTASSMAVDTLIVKKTGYKTIKHALSSLIQSNIVVVIDKLDNPAPDEDFTEEVRSVSFDMVYVPGGTFTIGCESGSCPSDTKPVSGVKVSNYHIGKTEVTTDLWNTVMGDSSSGFGGGPSITWYDAMEFACKLSQMTGRKYRMTTEAEWEYAAKNHLSSLEKIGSGEEWAYNSWNTTHSGGTDPVGPNSGKHTQKTRRDAQETTDNITGRLIRSIDGIGPALRLAISHEMDFPPGYVPPCDLHAPEIGNEPENSYRDPRWITGSGAHWTAGSIAIGSFDLRVWEDGTARMGHTNGQWFTSNNIAFVFVPSSGSSTKYAYIFLDETQGSLISDAGFMSGGYIGRIVKKSVDSVGKPTISGLQSGAELAAAAGDGYKMVDMVNIPESAKEQDPRLLDGTSKGWFQDNTSAGGVHHYRKDVDPDEFRFTVNQGQMTMLANGEWFTVNNTFLRVTHSSGYTTDYLYAITPDGTFYHNSFQAYERADFRIFQLKANSTTFPASCGSHCNDEIPKGEGPSLYANIENGHSTFVPAPCPTGGCK